MDQRGILDLDYEDHEMHESGRRILPSVCTFTFTFNSATHGLHRRVVNSQQDVNKMSDGRRNVVIR